MHVYYTYAFDQLLKDLKSGGIAKLKNNYSYQMWFNFEKVTFLNIFKPPSIENILYLQLALFICLGVDTTMMLFYQL